MDKKIVTHIIEINFAFFAALMYGEFKPTITPPFFCKENYVYNENAYSGTEKTIPLYDIAYFARLLEAKINNLFVNGEKFKKYYRNKHYIDQFKIVLTSNIQEHYNPGTFVDVFGEQKDPYCVLDLFINKEYFKDGRPIKTFNPKGANEVTRALTYLHKCNFEQYGYSTDYVNAPISFEDFTTKNTFTPEIRGITFGTGKTLTENNWPNIRDCAIQYIFNRIKNTTEAEENSNNKFFIQELRNELAFTPSMLRVEICKVLGCLYAKKYPNTLIDSFITFQDKLTGKRYSLPLQMPVNFFEQTYTNNFVPYLNLLGVDPELAKE